MTKLQHRRLLAALGIFRTRLPNTNVLSLARLLYLLDMEHIAQTGRSVTGLSYYAQREGPEGRNPETGWSPSLILYSVSKREVADNVDELKSRFTENQQQIIEKLIAEHIRTGGVSTLGRSNPHNAMWLSILRNGEGFGRMIQPILLEKPMAPDRRVLNAIRAMRQEFEEAQELTEELPEGNLDALKGNAYSYLRPLNCRTRV